MSISYHLLDVMLIYLFSAAFVGPLLTNLVLSSLLLWRLLTSASTHLLLFLLSKLSPRIPSIVLHSAPRTIAELIIDAGLIYYIWPIVSDFASGPLWLRLRHGFHPTEIVFRKPTGWRSAHLASLPRDRFQAEWQDALAEATDWKLVGENPGDNTGTDVWAVDYRVTGEAYDLVRKGVVSERTWDLSVWYNDYQADAWAVWQLSQMHTEVYTSTLLAAIKVRRLLIMMSKWSNIQIGVRRRNLCCSGKNTCMINGWPLAA